MSSNVKMAFHAIRAAHWRSIFTMFGIIVGVVSVVTIISLGEGIKRQIAGQIGQFGDNVITIRPGKLVDRNSRGQITKVNVLAGLGSASFSEGDIQTVKNVDNVQVVAPLSVVTGVAQINGRQFSGGNIFGTTADMGTILDQKVQFGGFFTAEESDKNIAIIGRNVAEQLFAENVPMGKSFNIRGQTFIVEGILGDLESNPLAAGSDFNSAIFIPYNVAKNISGGTTQIFQILVKPKTSAALAAVSDKIHTALLAAHGSQEDFTILRQDENLIVSTNTLNTITDLIAGIAAISLVVGGIGIMNIMLVSVTERTREIGLRKAVGATDRQIMTQFIVEAAILSLVGGGIGIVLSIFANFLIRIFTNLRPVITPQVILAAAGVALVVGIVFGTAPALKAARKNPIEALRFE